MPVITTSDGGSTWSEQVVSAPTGVTLRAVSCATTSDCTALGSTIAGVAAAEVTTDGGSSWRSETLPGTLMYLMSVACEPGSPTSCEAAGELRLAEAGVILGS